MVDNYKHYILAVWAVLVVAYVRYKAPIIWQVDWTHDDLMNAYRAMQTPWSELIQATFYFWQPTPLFRPLGEIFYKILWDQFGFDPLPWRIACGALLIGNAFLIGHIARRLSESLSVGLAAMAISSFHTMWGHLYMNTGTVFEILAFTAVYCGLAYYIEFKDPWGTTLILILGLNAKESVVILPVLVVLYEWIWHRRTPWLFCGLATVVCGAFIFGRVFGQGGISSIGSYQPDYSAARYFKSFRRYFGFLVLWLNIPIWAAPILAALPLLLRTRYSTFAAILFPVAILPLAFVSERTLEGIYIACAALAFALSSLLLKLSTEEKRLAAASALFVAVGFWMPRGHLPENWDREYREIRGFRESLQSQMPQLPPEVQLRFVSEPFTEEYPWASTFITRLVYRNPDIVVVSKWNEHTRNLPESKDFASFEWKQDRLQRIK